MIRGALLFAVAALSAGSAHADVVTVANCQGLGRLAKNIAVARDIGRPMESVLAAFHKENRYSFAPASSLKQGEAEIRDIYEHPQITAEDAEVLAQQNCGWVPLARVLGR
jgi:hypothetical protein